MEQTQQHEANTSTHVQPKAPEEQRIGFDDFLKVEMRVCKIISVEPVQNADKLYRITVSLGSSERTVVAGLRQYYTTEQLIGKHAIILANLAPRTLRGIESQGMLLAADDGTHVKLLGVDESVKLGARIR